MLGYGLINSSIHELCLTEIVFCFLSRSSIFLTPYYFKLYSEYQTSGVVSKKDIEALVNLFFEEEKILYIYEIVGDTSFSSRPESPKSNEILHRYILSALLIKDPNYNFDIKDVNAVINEGIQVFTDFFYKILKDFFNTLNKTQDTKTLLPGIPTDDLNEYDKFLVELIKYSTFIFENASLIKRNFEEDKMVSNVGLVSDMDNNSYALTSYMTLGGSGDNFEYSKATPDKNCNLQEQKNFNYFSTGGKFFNSGRDGSEEKANKTPVLFGEFYYSAKKDKIEELYKLFLNDIDIDDTKYNVFYDLQKVFSENTCKEFLEKSTDLYYQNSDDYVYSFTPGTFRVKENSDLAVSDAVQLTFRYFDLNNSGYNNYTDTVRVVSDNTSLSDLSFQIDKTHSLEIFGKWYYGPSTGQQEKINTINDVVSKSVKLNSKNYLQIRQQYNNKGYLEWKYSKFLYLGFDYQLDINLSLQEQSSPELISDSYTTVSRKEILKYYKFSFRELDKLAKRIYYHGKKIEDFFDLNFRIMLNLNHDIDNNQVSGSLVGHPVYALFNIYRDMTPQNLYAPFYKNDEFVSGSTILANNFVIDLRPEEVSGSLLSVNKNKYGSQIMGLYSFLSQQNNGNQNPEDNSLIKMLFKKEGVVITTDNLLSLEPLENKFNYFSNQKIKYSCEFENKNEFKEISLSELQEQLKINYLMPIADINLGSQGQIYTNFETESQPRNSLYNIKLSFYNFIISKINEEINQNIKLRSLLESINFEILLNANSYSNSNILKEYEEEITSKDSKIIDFYTSPLENSSNSEINKLTIITPRDNALNILEQQIKVLENG